MKKIILSVAAVALLGGFVAGCAKTETKPAAPIVAATCCPPCSNS